MVLGAILLLGATYVYRNAGSERYLSELLPIAAVAAGFAVAPALSPARAPEPRARRLHGLWRPLLPVAAIGLTLVITPPRPPLALDTFAALAGPLAQAPAGTLVSAAPDAYGFLLPDRPQQALRPGVRGLILLDGAQRAYDPALGARGVVVARLSAPDGFERPDGSLDTAPVLLIRGVVTAAR